MDKALSASNPNKRRPKLLIVTYFKSDRKAENVTLENVEYDAQNNVE